MILENLGPKVSQDPAVQAYLDWSGYWNGTTLDATKVLPQNLILPMRLWQRVTGQNAEFCPMTQWLDGLPSMPATAYNLAWERRGDAIYLIGSNSFLDYRIRYANYLPDFIETSAPSLPWYGQEVKVVRASDSLSLYVCAEIAGSRPDLELDTAAFTQAAENAAKLIYNRDVRQKQRVNVRRLSRSGRLEGSGYANSW